MTSRPTSVDVDAETPAEIALSVLAEIVTERDSLGRDRPAGAESTHDVDEPGQPATAGDAAVVDPVCGMTVHPESAAASVEHEGETYYFCCEGCADAFVEQPGEHLGTA